MSETEWRSVAGYEGVYEVSRDGQIRSLDRMVHFISRWGTPAVMPKRGLVLTPSAHPTSGHLTVGLGPAPEYRYVHHLVLEAFVGPRPAGQEGLHGDGNPANNRAANLRWGTRAQNSDDAVRHGTHPQAKKTACPRGHNLTEPNLVRSKLPRRQCLSCDRSKRSAAYHGYSDAWVQCDSDRRYREIMAGAAPVARRRTPVQIPAQGSAAAPARPGTSPTRANGVPTAAPGLAPVGGA